MMTGSQRRLVWLLLAVQALVLGGLLLYPINSIMVRRVFMVAKRDESYTVVCVHCGQLNRIQPGLQEAVLDHDAQGKLIRKAGIMGIVLSGGEVRPADPIRVELPSGPHQPLEPV